jgi:hypothetical protein
MPYGVDEGNICPCCGTQFGFDDDLGVSYRDIRDRWVAAGTPWFSPIDSPPMFWDGTSQLILSDYDFTPLDDRSVETPQDADVNGTTVAVGFALAAA